MVFRRYGSVSPALRGYSPGGLQINNRDEIESVNVGAASTSRLADFTGIGTVVALKPETRAELGTPVLPISAAPPLRVRDGAFDLALGGLAFDVFAFVDLSLALAQGE